MAHVASEYQSEAECSPCVQIMLQIIEGRQADAYGIGNRRK